MSDTQFRWLMAAPFMVLGLFVWLASLVAMSVTHEAGWIGLSFAGLSILLTAYRVALSNR